MDTLGGRTVVVTGAGSGIGRGLALAFAGAGANVVLADIEEDAAIAVAGEVKAAGVEALAVRTDVTDLASVEELADRSYERFGEVHVLCNNAGVFIMGAVADAIVDDWRWIFGVNVIGVANCVHTFLPRLLAQGSPAHIVNTASVAAIGGEGVYGASKTAVMSMSESLHKELSERGIGVSVLCPANISSRILGAQRNRPAEFGRKAPEPFGTDVTEFGLAPIYVGRRAVEAVLGDELYVFVFPDGWQAHLRPMAEQRFTAILEAIDRGGVVEDPTA